MRACELPTMATRRVIVVLLLVAVVAAGVAGFCVADAGADIEAEVSLSDSSSGDGGSDEAAADADQLAVMESDAATNDNDGSAEGVAGSTESTVGEEGADDVAEDEDVSASTAPSQVPEPASADDQPAAATTAAAADDDEHAEEAATATTPNEAEASQDGEHPEEDEEEAAGDSAELADAVADFAGVLVYSNGSHVRHPTHWRSLSDDDEYLGTEELAALEQEALLCEYRQLSADAKAKAELVAARAAARAAQRAAKAAKAAAANEAGHADGSEGSQEGDEEEGGGGAVEAPEPPPEASADVVNNPHHHSHGAESLQCEQLAYRLARVRQHRAAVQAAAVTAASGAPQHAVGDMAEATVASAAGAGYEGFFTQFALPGVPAVLRATSQAGNGAASDSASALVVPPPLRSERIAAVHDAAQRYAAVTRSSLAVGLATGMPWSACCAADVPELVLPAIVAGDYLQRVAAVASNKHFRVSHAGADGTAKQWRKRWPVLRSARADGTPVPLAVTPHRMHCALVVLEGHLDVRVYPRDEVPLLRPNIAGVPAEDAFAAGSGAGEHFARGQRTGTPAGPGDVVFVPSGAAAAFRAGDGQADDTLLLQHCFVDASNLNEVKRELAVEGLVDSDAAMLGHMLEQSQLEVDMDRVPRPISFQNYASWPRPSADSVVDSLVADINRANPVAVQTEEEREQALESEPRKDKRKGARKRRHRHRQRRATRGSGARLKQWQAEQRWNTRLRLLTVPAPASPGKFAVGRTNVTLRFRCPFTGDHAHTHDAAGNSVDGSKHMITGYMVVWNTVLVVGDHSDHDHTVLATTGSSTAAALQRALVALGATRDAASVDADTGTANAGGGGVADNVTLAQMTRSLAGFHVHGSAIFMFADTPSLLNLGCGTGLVDVLCAPIVGLLPGHTYRFKVAAITDEGPGTFSDVSPPVSTDVETLPTAPRDAVVAGHTPASVTLRWKPPLDDGGAPVLGYIVACRRAGEATFDEVVVVGPMPQTTLGALIPSQHYHFKVAAVNEIGLSKFTSPPTSFVVSSSTTTGGSNSVVVHGVDPTSSGGGGEAMDADMARNDRLAVVAHAVVVDSLEEAGLGHFVSTRADGSMDKSEALAHLAVQRQGIAFFGGSAAEVRRRQRRAASVRGREGARSVQPGHTQGGLSSIALERLEEMLADVEASDGGEAAGSPTPCFGPAVVVSDIDQTVRLAQGGEVEAADPRLTFQGWAGAYSPQAYAVHAELVAARPLSGAGTLQNEQALRNRVVFFERGTISLRDKVLIAASAGALAVVVADTGGPCDQAFSQMCVRGADKSRGERFAQTDRASHWEGARIPVVLLRRADGEALRGLLA